METVSEQVRQYIEQEIEIYGDDYSISRNFLNSSPAQSVSVQIDTLFFEGNENAKLVVVLESSEPAQKAPQSFFTGEHGELFTKILASIGFSRDDVYTCVLPRLVNGQNSSELSTSTANLFAEINKINPLYILCFGKLAGQVVCKTHNDVDKLRGKELMFGNAGVIVTHHPVTLAKNDKLKRETWEDMKMLQRLYNNRMQEN